VDLYLATLDVEYVIRTPRNLPPVSVRLGGGEVRWFRGGSVTRERLGQGDVARVYAAIPGVSLRPVKVEAKRVPIGEAVTGEPREAEPVEEREDVSAPEALAVPIVEAPVEVEAPVDGPDDERQGPKDESKGKGRGKGHGKGGDARKAP